MLYPHALRIQKSLTPPPLRNFYFFLDPLKSLFDCLKLLTNRKIAPFSPVQEDSAHNFRSSKQATQVC